MAEDVELESVSAGDASGAATQEFQSLGATAEAGAGAADASQVQVEVASEETGKTKKKKMKKKGSSRKSSAKKRREDTATQETFKSLTEELHGHFSRLRQFSVAAAFTHFFVTVLLFIMGYSKEGTTDLQGGTPANASASVVVTAFGALLTCVYAFTSTFNTYKNTGKQLTTRAYHNGAFLAAVIRGFFLIFFMWPGLVIFILHGLGNNFWTVVGHVTGTPRTVLVLDILICIVVGIVDIIGFLFATSKLATFKQPDAEQEEAKEEKKAEDGTPAVSLPEQEEEEMKPIGRTEYVLPAINIFVYVLLDAVLVAVSYVVAWNSGAVLSLVVHLFLLALFLWLAYQLLNNNTERVFNKSHVINYRVYMMVHLTALVAVFWVGFAIVLLAKGLPDTPPSTAPADYDCSVTNSTCTRNSQSFFQAVFALTSGRTALVCMQLAAFVVTIVNYVALLIYHQKSLATLDEIASLHLVERTNA